MRFWMAGIAAVVLSGELLAQQIPQSVLPERQIRRPEPASPPRFDVPAVVPEQAEDKAPLGADRIAFMLRSIDLQGVTAYRPDAFADHWRDLLNANIRLSDIYRIAAELTAKVRADGYFLSRVIVPPQEIEDGVVRLQMIEGWIANVKYDPDALPGRRDFIDQMAARIKAYRPVSFDVVDRQLRLMRRLYGIDVKSVPQPSDIPGASDLVLEFSREPFDGAVELDNRGTRFNGPLELSLNGAVQSTFGHYERIELELLTALDGDELRTGSIKYSQPLNADGLQLDLFGSLVSSQPGDTLEPFNIDGRSLSMEATLTYPFVLQQSATLNGSAGLSILNAKTDSNIGATNNVLSHDRIRAVRLGVDGRVADRYQGLNAASVELSQGLDILNARETGSDNLSRENGQSDFTALKLDLSRIQALGSGFSLLGRMTGQYALDPLLASEQFDVGGEDLGRGYDPSEISGDHGLAGLVELRYSQFPNLPSVENYQFYLGYDAGMVWLKKPSALEERSLDATSVSTGVRSTMFGALNLNLELAYPISRSPTVDRSDGKREPRFFFSAAWKF